LSDKNLEIGSSPIYIFITKEVPKPYNLKEKN